VRLVEELQRLGEDVVVLVDHAPPKYLAAAEQAGVPIVRGGQRDPAALWQVGVETAQALALTEQDDVGNLHAALAAQELNSGLRIVLRIFNEPLRRSIGSLLNDCVALSASAIAAPLFVAAALGEEETRQIEVAGRRLTVASASGGSGENGFLFALAGETGDGAQTLLPHRLEGNGLVLRDADPPPPGAASQAPAHHARLPAGPLLDRINAALIALATLADRRFRRLLVAIALLVGVSVGVFSLFGGISPLDALYFTITTITTTGYGDITVLNKPLGIKLYGMALIVVGATSLALLYALLIDALVGARLTRALGGVRHRMAGHVVVCGVGNVGLKVVQELARREIPVVVVERDEASPNMQTVRRLGVSVVVADASREESLRSAHVDRAKSLIAVTDDDITNLGAALNARSVHPELRVVLRLFDHDLAARVDRAFQLSVSRSVSALVAPAFTAAVLGRRVLSLIPVGREVLLVVEIPLEPSCELDGVAASHIDAIDGVQVLAVRSCNGNVTWHDLQALLRGGDTVIAVATRSGLGLLTALAAGKDQGCTMQERPG
jgi:Trk K+ transport system NAD-binding subunit